jgi:hypothetical protein
MAFPQLRSGWRGNPLVEPPGNLTHYALTAESGANNWTGTDSSLEAGWLIVAEAGSHNWTGTAADLEAGWVVTGEAGAYTWTGQDAEFIYVTAGSQPQQVWSNPEWQRNYPRAFHPGHSKPFRQNSPSTASVAADPGAFGWTGTDASLEFGGLVVADSGAFSWTGSDADFSRAAVAEALNLGSGLVKGRSYPRAFHPAHQKPFRQSGGTPNYLISADVGVYNWTGIDATLFLTPVTTGTAVPFHFKTKAHPRPFMPSVHGAFRSAQGQSLGNLLVNLSGPHRDITAEGGTYVWTGQDATLISARLVSAEGGSYTWAGTATTLNYGKTILIDPGVYVWVGTDATLKAGLEFAADGGEYLWSGIDAALSTQGRFVAADSGSFLWTGTTAALRPDYHLDVDIGEYIWLVSDADLQWSAQPSGGAGGLLLLGVG